jgi:hypothetical protein
VGHHPASLSTHSKKPIGEAPPGRLGFAYSTRPEETGPSRPEWRRSASKEKAPGGFCRRPGCRARGKNPRVATTTLSRSTTQLRGRREPSSQLLPETLSSLLRILHAQLCSNVLSSSQVHCLCSVLDATSIKSTSRPKLFKPELFQ